MAPAGGLVPPAYFTPELRQRWAEILRLAPANILRPIDAGTLEDYVVNEDIARRAYAAVGDALTVEGDKATVRNPNLMTYAKAVEVKRAAADRLGFSPSARVGLPLDDTARSPGDGEDDRWTQILSMGKPVRPTAEQFAAQRRRGKRVEATIGREGCTGVQAALGAKSSAGRLLVQIPGSAAKMSRKAIRLGYRSLAATSPC